jgi:hypothetical protein
MNNSYVVIGQCNVDAEAWLGESFVCENDKSQQILTEQQAKELKEGLDKLYSKDYSYHIAKLTYLD